MSCASQTTCTRVLVVGNDRPWMIWSKRCGGSGTTVPSIKSSTTLTTMTTTRRSWDLMALLLSSTLTDAIHLRHRSVGVLFNYTYPQRMDSIESDPPWQRELWWSKLVNRRVRYKLVFCFCPAGQLLVTCRRIRVYQAETHSTTPVESRAYASHQWSVSRFPNK